MILVQLGHRPISPRHLFHHQRWRLATLGNQLEEVLILGQLLAREIQEPDWVHEEEGNGEDLGFALVLENANFEKKI